MYDKLPSMGGIGPTSSFSLKSLKSKRNINTKVKTRAINVSKVHRVWATKNACTYNTARACIRPMTSGILPVSLFPWSDLQNIRCQLQKTYDNCKSFICKALCLIRKINWSGKSSQCCHLKESNIVWYLSSDLIVRYVPEVPHDQKVD